MEQKINIVLLKDITWFIGYKDDTKKVTVMPYIYNSNWSKIKILTDNKIYESQPISPLDIIEKNYNLKCWGFVTPTTIKDVLKKPIPTLSAIMEDKKITSKQMLSIKSHFERKYQKIVNKYFKTELQEQANKAFQDAYKNF